MQETSVYAVQKKVPCFVRTKWTGTEVMKLNCSVSQACFLDRSLFMSFSFDSMEAQSWYCRKLFCGQNCWNSWLYPVSWIVVLKRCLRTFWMCCFGSVERNVFLGSLMNEGSDENYDASLKPSAFYTHFNQNLRQIQMTGFSKHTRFYVVDNIGIVVLRQCLQYEAVGTLIRIQIFMKEEQWHLFWIVKDKDFVVALLQPRQFLPLKNRQTFLE